MIIKNYEWSTHWEIGNYEIRWDRRSRQFDVAEGVCHLYCVNTLEGAINFILKHQGWGPDLADEAAPIMAKILETSV